MKGTAMISKLQLVQSRRAGVVFDSDLKKIEL
jgi:hypothetical protein